MVFNKSKHSGRLLHSLQQLVQMLNQTLEKSGFSVRKTT